MRLSKGGSESWVGKKMATVLENKAALGRWRSFRRCGVLSVTSVNNESGDFKTRSRDDVKYSQR